MLKAAVNRDNQNPFAWYQLGIIYDREGDQPRAALATAERNNLEGNPKLALASAEMAMQGHPAGHARLSSRPGHRHGVADRAARKTRNATGERTEAASAAQTVGFGAGARRRRDRRGADRRAAAVRGAAAGRQPDRPRGAAGRPADPRRHRRRAARPAICSRRSTRSRAALETPFGSSWKGAAKPDVVLVEFFDYACAYCRASNPHIERLLRGGQGPARGLSASCRSSGRTASPPRACRWPRRRPAASASSTTRCAPPAGPAPETIAAAAQAAGHHAADRRRAPTPRPSSSAISSWPAQLGATGTPLFIVGDRVMNSAVGYDALKKAIADARAKATSKLVRATAGPLRCRTFCCCRSLVPDADYQLPL